MKVSLLYPFFYFTDIKFYIYLCTLLCDYYYPTYVEANLASFVFLSATIQFYDR